MRKQTPRFRAARSACMLSLAVRRRWVGAIGLGEAAAVTASVFACQQLVGIPGDPPVPTAVSACGLPYGNNACASCAATSCCTESTACAADPVCAAFETCLGKSNGDWQARSQCAIDHPAGSSTEVSPLSACLVTNCISECGLARGAYTRRRGAHEDRRGDFHAAGRSRSSVRPACRRGAWTTVALAGKRTSGHDFGGRFVPGMNDVRGPLAHGFAANWVRASVEGKTTSGPSRLTDDLRTTHGRPFPFSLPIPK